ncbi:uncharacterized protein LOC113143977 [Mastacembelus armatus]|uniref:uncharacterized protein LOC113143977 n=1 Tax=Mastacembelus armatus TaxID=205130 RepID=UPI000E45CFF1|nr:uncharacterized protein LOC113143977 [Mastacembelus armatus]
MTEISLNFLLAHFLIVGVGSVCIPVQCLKCNITGVAGSCAVHCGEEASCINDIPSNCTKDFQVSIKSTGSNVNEGDDITLTCDCDLPNVTLIFGWKKDGVEILESQNKSELHLPKVLTSGAGQYTCYVNSSCGSYVSSPHKVTVNNQSMVLLVICGVSALLLVTIMGLVMKFKLKRDNAKYRERRQRELAEQGGGPGPFTQRRL